jgi:hypothetical protein
MTRIATSPMPNVIFRSVMIVLCITGLLGAGVAFRSNQAYLGARLLALVAAALPAALFSEQFIAVLRTTSRGALIGTAVFGSFVLCVVVVSLFPRPVFHLLNHLLDLAKR